MGVKWHKLYAPVIEYSSVDKVFCKRRKCDWAITTSMCHVVKKCFIEQLWWFY